MRAPRLVIGVAAATCAALVGACGDTTRHVTPGQVLLHVDTDAPVPAAADQSPGLASPLFDRLRVDVYPQGATSPCAECTNDFELDRRMFEQAKVSVGIVPPLHVAGARARVRLYKADFASKAGEPNAASTIDVTVALPIVDADAIVERTVRLLTDTVGTPQGTLDAPIEPELLPPAVSQVGTWLPAARVECPGAPPQGAVCVPGGAYWMGHPNAPGFTPRSYTPDPRLVALAPFFMSAAEVSVAEFRASGLVPDETWNGRTDGRSIRDYCTFAPSASPRDVLPINCVALATAKAYCAKVGGELPTEAQFEYVAGGLVGERYPWGHDEPACDDAVYGRGGWGLLEIFLSPCRPATPPGSPEAAGWAKRDRLDLPGGSIFDLAGNMTEWTRDVWNRIDEPCWKRPGVYRDPVCATPSPSDGLLAVRRGGDWAETAAEMVSYQRFSIAMTEETVQSGFRCVWPAK